MQPNSDRQRRSLFRFFWPVVAGAMVAALLVRALVAQVYFVPSGSMQPTLHVGDRVLIEKVSRWWGPPVRGEIVAFDGTDVWGGTADGLLVAKRVIGVAGDHIMCCDARGRIRVNGVALVEPYAQGRSAEFDVRVPLGRLWVLGDDRAHSKDSSTFTDAALGGSVPVNHVLGRVVGIVWPLERAGILGSPRMEDPNDAD
jgi:signal peptidase I